MTSRSLATACALACLGLPTTAASQPAPSRSPRIDVASTAPAAGAVDLAAIRSATERYADVAVALADGYLRDPANHCVTADMLGHPAETGAMGIHYLRPDLLGVTATEPRLDGSDTVLDWLQPELLLYEPRADGSVELAGVEYLVFTRAWHEAGNAEPPSLLGTPFTHMEDDPATELDEGHGFMPHYDLHVWLHRENPTGTFADWNPAVSCAHHRPVEDHTGH